MIADLGYVTVVTPGTPVQATINIATGSPQMPFTRGFYPVHGVLFQAYSSGAGSNVGRIYILRSGGDKSTGVGLLAVLGIPSGPSIPSASFTITAAVADLDVAAFFIDADVSMDRCLISALVI